MVENEYSSGERKTLMELTVNLPQRLDDTCIQGNTRNSTTLPNKIGEVLLSNNPFSRDKAGCLYFYANGVYHEGGEYWIERLYKLWLEQNGAKDDWRDNMGAKIAKWIVSDSRCRLLWEKPPLATINLLNGLYDWDQHIMNPHSPEYLSTVQIPIMYNKDAECPTWDKFLHEVLPVKGGDDYLRQVIALCLTPFTGVQKCIVLVGEGSNGKSTFLNGLQRAIGLDNISNIPLHVLTNPMERFAKAGLVGKLVNVFGDMSKKKIEDAGNFKALVGEDRLPIEKKHKDTYYYTPFCKLIFSCNQIVESDDESAGYKRRFVNIPFTRKFKTNPQVGLELAEKLSQPEEMSGLLNKVLPFVGSLISEGLVMSPEVAGIIDDWCVIPDSIQGWLEQVLVPEEDALLHIEGFYNYYVEMSPPDDLPREHSKLVKYIRRVFSGVQVEPMEIGGKTVMCYKGIRTKSRELGNEWLYQEKMWE
jgi:putative DNA primase/helicase